MSLLSDRLSDLLQFYYSKKTLSRRPKFTIFLTHASLTDFSDLQTDFPQIPHLFFVHASTSTSVNIFLSYCLHVADGRTEKWTCINQHFSIPSMQLYMSFLDIKKGVTNLMLNLQNFVLHTSRMTFL